MTLQSKALKGTGVALVTPFLKNGRVDYKSLEKLVGHILRGKCEYLVPLGTTGESVTLTEEEKSGVMDCVTEAVAGRVPVVMGAGGNNTEALIEKLTPDTLKGVNALLSVSPYYNKPSQKGIIAHYKALASASPLPIILYNVPARTGSNMTAETTLVLAHEVKGIIGIKEASGDMELAMNILAGRPSGFLVISGDDALTLPMMAAGADGSISVVANLFPGIFSGMVRAMLENDLRKARTLHYRLLPLIPLLFAEGNPSGIKQALNWAELCGSKVRLPLTGISGRLTSDLEKVCKTISGK